MAQSIDKEIIIVNDGSSDKSLNIALDFANRHHHITVLHCNQNKGVSHVRNQALNLARGEWICFVDSDDWLDGDYFAQMIDMAHAHHADIIRYQAQRVFQGQVYPIPSHLDHLNHQIYKMTALECFYSLAYHAWIPGICWTLIKQKLIEKHRLRFVEDSTIEDQLFYIELLTCQDDINVLEFPYHIYQYRLNPQSTTGSPSVQYFLDHFYVIDKIHQMQHQKHPNNDKMQRSLAIITMRLSETALQIYDDFSSHTQQELTTYAHTARQIIQTVRAMQNTKSSPNE